MDNVRDNWSDGAQIAGRPTPQVLLVDDDQDFGPWLAHELGRAGFATTLMTGLDSDKTLEHYLELKPAVVVLDRRLGENELGGDELAHRFREGAAGIRREATQRGLTNPDAQYDPYIILCTRFPAGDFDPKSRGLINDTVVVNQHRLPQDLIVRVREGLGHARHLPRLVTTRGSRLVLGADGVGHGGWLYDPATGAFILQEQPGMTPPVILQGYQRVIFNACARQINGPCTMDYLIDALERTGWEPDVNRDAGVYIRNYIDELRGKLRRLHLDPETVLPRARPSGFGTCYTLYGFYVP
jgi:CheY-like chemotaxis protein